ncbi:MAG: hypothetical protein K2N75_03175 [Helicobacter sp.]|nr:hypothetical protein [Helicobacter sp.]MDE5925970.1 hypothetical protein [Helicobacter sp.]MDE7175039.1 hypothetical protein [Helicobacter sp.]
MLNPYWKQEHIISDGILNLVRAINTKYFDNTFIKLTLRKQRFRKEQKI